MRDVDNCKDMNIGEIKKILTCFLLPPDIRSIQDIPVKIPEDLQDWVPYLNPTP